MKPEKYDRSIILYCPTCGGTEFEFDDENKDSDSKVRCITCDREIAKDELIHENSENIQEHVLEIGKEVSKDIAKELKENLKKIFKGNKNITFN